MSLRSTVRKSNKRPATKPSKRNSIGNMNSSRNFIARGMQKIANRTKPAPKTKKYTVGQLGVKPYQPTAQPGAGND